ncbi:MAG: zeta toxin family protein [Bacteroidales bacterium]|nr:zeta toxin family protein [Bacteroidales bacterium]
MPNLYIISGCNGAGKTTASFTILPEMLNCEEFINADEVARGLSPFNPNKVAIEAGRIMLKKIDKLISNKQDFAFETTLAPKSYLNTIQNARKNGYEVTLLYLWLDSIELALKRVETRVIEGGHNIPEDVIKRRYISGIKNLFELYVPICNYWMIFDNSNPTIELIAEGSYDKDIVINDRHKYDLMKQITKL